MQADPQPPSDQQRVHDALMQLVDVGTTLLDAVAAKAKSGADLAELTPQYDTIGRGLRKTALLLDQLARPAADTAQPDRLGARKRIVREVEDAIHHKARGPSVDTLRAELAERLDAPDLEHDIASRPIHEIIRDICRDFGLLGTPGQFPRRTAQDVQDLFARAATPPGAKSKPPTAPNPPPPPPPPEPQPEPEFEPETAIEDDDEIEPPPLPAFRQPPPPKPQAAPETAASLLHYLTRSRGT